MFGESRWVTALIVAGVVVVLVVFGLLIRYMFGMRAESGEFSSAIVTSSQTTVYVNPEDCPLCQAHGNTGVLEPGSGGVADPDQTPNVTGQGTSAGQSSGGFFGSVFSSTPKDIPAGYSARDLSGQFRRVRISSVRRYQGNAAATNADTVVLAENIGSGDSPVNITGWRVQANQGAYVIQRAAKVYRTAGSQLTNVTLANGQSANIYSGASAVRANFMGNSCMGYLSTQYDFVPKLSGTCVRPAKSEIATFSGACQDYILKLKTCQAGDPYDSRIPESDAACRSFVANLNYDGCVKTRQNDARFFTNVWNIWSGNRFLDPLHDRVLLLDANGKLVDWYLY